MFLTDEERRMARPKIAIVRDFIGAVNDNPFFHGLGRDALIEKMEEIASDVKSAAAKLSELTGVENTVPDEAVGTDYLASGILALSHINEEAVEITLCAKFMQYCAQPYFKLRELETDERLGGAVCPEKAREAMDSLASLHMLVKTVPVVYDYISAPGLDRSVA